MKHYIIQRVFLLITVLQLTACATFTEKFQSNVEANVGIFADNTLTLLNSAEFGFTKQLSLYTRDFYSLEEPEEIQLAQTKDDVYKALRAIMSYSLKLVAITDIHKNTQERVEAYSKYLYHLDDDILETLELDQDYYNDLIQQVSEQEKFMDALVKAQPVINAWGRLINQSLDDLKVASEKLENKLDKRIDSHFADLIRYQGTLEKEKYSILSALEQLYLSANGDVEAYRKLKNGETVVPIKMVPDSSLTEEQRYIIVKYLEEKLDFWHRIALEIEEDWQIYRETHKELDRLHARLEEEILEIRLIAFVWVRAHQRMASGVTTPAAWFDINEAPGLILKLGTEALF